MMKLTHTMIGLAAAVAVSMISIVPAFASTNTVTVQPGQTMYTISQAEGISLQSLENANPNVDPSNMNVGTQLALPQSNSSYDTPGNLYWMGQVINAEAGGQSLQAQIAVGDVILHRMESGQWGGNTVYDVVFDQSNGVYQFTSVQNGYIYSTPNASSIQAAQDVLQNGVDEVPGAFVFYNPSQTSAGNWVWSKPVIAQYDNLNFAQ
ncbi:cell wall hydrolase [Alicyclobacillus tolerans]|uniref:cell wall hydrolase n=1 Tax=Alicyclobacillus tolerans TaxID=90970 RepID=UPI001F36B70A|nr:cell wall hydrolase [Alicyclobacillus tolerans]MCF8568295.1 cell wall hydrolase [Alicyclobacillus tolerans]